MKRYSAQKKDNWEITERKISDKTKILKGKRREVEFPTTYSTGITKNNWNIIIIKSKLTFFENGMSIKQGKDEIILSKDDMHRLEIQLKKERESDNMIVELEK